VLVRSSILLLLWLARPCAAVEAPVFPRVQVTDLDGKAVELPRALSGPCLVVVGFSHASGGPSKQWQERFCAATVSASACPVLEVVELESAPFFVAPLVKRGLRRDVPPGLYGHVFIAREGKAALQAALAFDTGAPDDPYLALLDGQGRIQWFGHGPWSQGRQDALTRALGLLQLGVKIPLGAAGPP
jgi:hypothetical protein